MEDAERIRELEEAVAALSAKVKILEDENARLSALINSEKKRSKESKRRECIKPASNQDKPIQQRFVALKIMYIGTRYHGFASQGPAQKTVESELFAALTKTRFISGTLADAKYSRCGRTDKGVSATAQVVSLYLRSKKKNTEEFDAVQNDEDRVIVAKASRQNEDKYSGAADDDEIDYINALNRALPIDIRVIGWCPVPPGFHARFSCLYREYKYFFINDGMNIEAMKEASQKLVGSHDFRNFCKMDAENIHNYTRHILSFDIVPLNHCYSSLGRSLWVVQVQGNAFLWHQVRCMAAVLFMVGYGHEKPSIIDDLLDVEKVRRKPQYTMASERPLVLHNCAFQGLTFHCQHETKSKIYRHLQEQLDQVLLNSAIISEGMMQLGYSGSDQVLKAVHIPLLSRATEPTYDERRSRINGVNV